MKLLKVVSAGSFLIQYTREELSNISSSAARRFPTSTDSITDTRNSHSRERVWVREILEDLVFLGDDDRELASNPAQ
jgi:hypothetical protein